MVWVPILQKLKLVAHVYNHKFCILTAVRNQEARSAQVLPPDEQRTNCEVDSYEVCWIHRTSAKGEMSSSNLPGLPITLLIASSQEGSFSPIIWPTASLFVNPSVPICLHRRCLGWVCHGLRPLFFEVFDFKLYVTIERSVTIKGRGGALSPYK